MLSSHSVNVGVGTTSETWYVVHFTVLHFIVTRLSFPSLTSMSHVDMLNENVSFIRVASLLNQNGNDLITWSPMTWSVPNSSLKFAMVGLDNEPTISANGGSVTYRVKIDANRFSKSDVLAALQSLTYGYYDENGTAPTKFITSTW